MDNFKIERDYIIKDFWGKKLSQINDDDIELLDTSERKKHQRYVKAKIHEPNALDGGKLALTIGNQVKKDADVSKLIDEIIPFLRKYVVLIFPGKNGENIEVNLFDDETTINDLLDHRQLLDVLKPFRAMEDIQPPVILHRSSYRQNWRGIQPFFQVAYARGFYPRDLKTILWREYPEYLRIWYTQIEEESRQAKEAEIKR